MSAVISAIKQVEEGGDARFRIEATLSNISSLDEVITEVARELEGEDSIRQVILF